MNKKDSDKMFEKWITVINDRNNEPFVRKMAYSLMVAFGNAISKEHSFYTQREVLAVLQIIDESYSEELI